MSASIAYLDRLYPGARILIAGGGTGQILVFLDRLGMDLHVHFVDSSEKMVALASSRSIKNIEITFEHADIRKAHLKEYDFIITAFFLDCFNDQRLQGIVGILQKHLRKGGQWLFTDFVSSGIVRHRLLIQCMYVFFRIVSNLRVQHLPDYDSVFITFGYQIKERKIWLNGLIESRIYLR